jgi:stage V sporulation protein SpoVS
VQRRCCCCCCCRCGVAWGLPRTAHAAAAACASAVPTPPAAARRRQVVAIGHTRLHLEPDGLDVRAWPEFVKVTKGITELNAIKFHIHVDRLR